MADIQTYPTVKRQISLPNDIETIPQLNEFIDTVAEEIGLDMSLTMSLNLALEEAVVNVINYAYPTDETGDINIEATATATSIKFKIIDTGVAFAPTDAPDVDTSLTAEERQIGGLGIFLVRQLMDTINYERIEGKNVLTLTKKLS